METDYLVQVASQSAKKLDSLWNELGLTLEERRHEQQELAASVAQLYQLKIQSQEDLISGLKQGIFAGMEAIIRLSNALGQTVTIEAEEGTLKQRNNKVQHCLEGLQKMYNDTISEIQQLHTEIHELCREMGTQPRPPFHHFNDLDLSVKRINEYRTEVDTLSMEKAKRFALVSSLRDEVLELCSELSIVCDASVFDDLSDGGISFLEHKKQELGLEKQKREETVKEYAYRITSLWDQLDISEEERETFFAVNTGLGPSVIQACQGELRKLEERKQKQMKELVISRLHKIEHLWNEIQVSEHERRQFLAKYEGIYSDEVLKAYESTIEALSDRLEKLRPILRLIEKREIIKQEKIEFEASSSDPNRLLSKKTARDPGRLLREEKMRKTINKELPAVEMKLTKLITDWESQNGQEFLYSGQRYLITMQQDEDAERKRKEEERMRKEAEKAQKGRTPTKPMATPRAGKTPQSRNTALGNTLPSPASPQLFRSTPSSKTMHSPMAGKRPALSVLSPLSNTQRPSKLAKPTAFSLDPENSPLT